MLDNLGELTCRLLFKQSFTQILELKWLIRSEMNVICKYLIK